MRWFVRILEKRLTVAGSNGETKLLIWLKGWPFCVLASLRALLSQTRPAFWAGWCLCNSHKMMQNLTFLKFRFPCMVSPRWNYYYYFLFFLNYYYFLKPFMLFLILDFLFCTPWTTAGGSGCKSPRCSIQAAELSVVFGQQSPPPRLLRGSPTPIR